MRLYTKQPVHYEKDVSWDGSEDVRIEYQDVKITADKAHYDFATKTATLDGHVVIDQGPTRLSGITRRLPARHEDGHVEDATANLPPAYHIVADAIDKIGEATYLSPPRPLHVVRPSDVRTGPSPAEASVTLDDYARMKNVAFRAGTCRSSTRPT